MVSSFEHNFIVIKEIPKKYGELMILVHTNINLSALG